MKRIFASLAILTLASVLGCHAQMPPTAPVYVCPSAPAGGTAYAPINAPADINTPASVTATTYTDRPATGTWCYVVQTWALVSPTTTYQDSAPSNVAGPFTTTASLAGVALAWTAPQAPSGTTYSSVGYIVSRVAATAVGAPLAPSLSQPSGTAQVVTPKINKQEATAQLAMNAAPRNLQAIVNQK